MGTWYRCQKCGEYILGNLNKCPVCGYTVYDIPAIVPWKEKLKRYGWVLGLVSLLGLSSLVFSKEILRALGVE